MMDRNEQCTVSWKHVQNRKKTGLLLLLLLLFFLLLVPSGIRQLNHMKSSSIPNSKGEKNVRSPAALPTGGSAFCGALEDGMGEVLVSVEKSTSVVEVICSSIQGVAWTATLQSLHVPISVSLAATWMMYSFPA